MVCFTTIGQYEHNYCFIDAVTDVDVLNGTFGDVVDGKFVAGANASKAIMQVEEGDDMGMDKFVIPAGSHVRVADFARMAEHCHNKEIRVFGAQLPTEFAKGDKLVSDAEGKLVAGEGTPCYEIKEVIGNKLGVTVEVIAE